MELKTTGNIKILGKALPGKAKLHPPSKSIAKNLP